jgi:hypothetical protein
MKTHPDYWIGIKLNSIYATIMSKKYHLDIEPEALIDIQNAIDYYDSKKSGLGENFYKAIDGHFNLLKLYYHSFAIKYDDIRCLPLKKFPYVIHYKALHAQKTISVKTVFCTHENPDNGN